MNKYKTTEQKEGFSMGLLTMLMVNIGLDLFGMGSWATYIGAFLIVLATVNVFVYVGKPKENEET